MTVDSSISSDIREVR